jgi:hypothetical protein
MAKFEVLTDDKKGNPLKGESIFYAVDQSAISLMESLTAQEKAHIVPYLRIWRVDPRTGKPRWGAKDDETKPVLPLTLQFTEPPSFGEPVRHAERPPASLESFVLEQAQEKGRITIFKVTMKIVIHHPDALPLKLPEGRDSVGSLLSPGMVHAAEFGWAASANVKNDIFNGNGLPNAESSSIVPGRRTIYFNIVNYDPTFTDNGEIHVTLTGMESGLLNLRRWSVGEKAPQTIDLPDPATLPPRRGLKDYYKSPAGKKLKADLQNALNDVIKQNASGGKLKFIHFLNFLADTISNSFKESGYQKIYLRVGKFNERVGVPSARYGPVGKDMKGQSIGDFEIPVSDLRDKFAQLMKQGEEITVQNVLMPFLKIISEGTAWSNKNRPKSKIKDPLTGENLPLQSNPDVFGKIITNRDTIAFFILDAKREFTKISSDDFVNSDFEPTMPRSELKAELAKRQIPYIAFGHANSYIKEPKFNVNIDKLMQAHLIYQAYRGNPRPADAKNAGEITPSSATKVDAIDPGTLLFRSSIQGTIPMLGNFCFDMFATIWIDCLVPQWSGPYAIRNLKYEITRGHFGLSINVIAIGADPVRAALRREAKSSA